MSDITGAQLVARTLRDLGVDVVFGIVGIPVIEVAQACIDSGVRFIGFRNEQSAAYAAAAYGYLNNRPGVCLVVGGPGVIHAMAGTHHAEANAWPLMLMAGSSESYQQGMGAFQELDQVGLLKPHVKFAARAPSLHQLPGTMEKAYRTAFSGRPGPTYVDLPADHIQGKVEQHESPRVAPRAKQPQSVAPEREVAHALALLRSAKRPLLVIGKGAQYARAETPLMRLLEMMPIPFLPTPMGKGLISDKHPMCISAARSTALREADVVLVVGARLNWILHYGQSPKWNNDVKLIRLDINAESIDDNKSAEVALVGDASAIIDQLCYALGSEHGVTDPFAKMSDSQASWYKKLLSTCHDNSQKLIEKAMVFPRPAKGNVEQVALPLTYHQSFNIIRKNIPADHVFIGEGANTMDIARSMFDVVSPRSRLDAGTQATMGVGMGYCIAAAIHEQKRPERRPIVAVVGDSAFGFSGFEIETAVRNKLGMLIVVMNNGGVYKGLPVKAYNDIPVEKLPPTALLPELRYDQLCISLGGLGHCVRTIDELEKAVQDGIDKQNEGRVTLINVLMDSGSKKKLEFGWLASTKPKSKL